MTRIIINPRQLRAINEVASQMFQSDVSTLGTDVANAFNETPNAQSITMSLPGTGTGIATCTRKDVEQNGSSVLNSLPDKGSIGQVNITNDTVKESRYSKRQVELGRMLEMRRTGKVFSKKQLNEMFMETQENANELRSIFQNGGGRNLAFKVAEIIDDVFPEESYGSELLDAVLGGADPAEFIIQNIFSDFADKEEEREVLDRIRELTTKRGF